MDLVVLPDPRVVARAMCAEACAVGRDVASPITISPSCATEETVLVRHKSCASMILTLSHSVWPAAARQSLLRTDLGSLGAASTSLIVIHRDS
jgi:hypothetical protein